MTETYFSGGAVHTVEKENMLETSISPVFNRFEGAGRSELIGIRSFQVKHTKSLCGKKKKKNGFCFPSLLHLIQLWKTTIDRDKVRSNGNADGVYPRSDCSIRVVRS